MQEETDTPCQRCNLTIYSSYQLMKGFSCGQVASSASSLVWLNLVSWNLTFLQFEAIDLMFAVNGLMHDAD
jgi:hypothetical protein